MTTRWEIRVDEANPEEEIPLTENGRIVLERRYLRKGPDGRPVETIPQMFRRVARAIAEAEKELGGDPALWEERFYQLLTSLRFLPNSPTFTGAGTPLGQLAACFTPEIRVITEHGLKRIADLQPGDRVLTHRGRYQPVLQTSRRFYRGPLRIIKVRRIGRRIEATPEHPFLTPRGWVMAADLRPGDRVAIGFPKGILPTPSFDLAETLSGEDLEVQSTPTTIRVRRPAAYQNSGRQARWIPRHIPLSSEVARLCGYYVAEGTLGPDLEYVRFTFSIKEKEYHADVSNILSSILGFTPIMNSSRGNWVHIDLYNRALAQWFFTQFGRHSYNKRIPIWMQYANFDLQEEFLTGLFRGDGFYSEKAYLINGRKSAKLFRAFRLTLSNPTLIFQTWQILLRLGYEASIRGVDTAYVTPNAREAAQIIMPPLRSRRLIEKAFGIHLPDAGVSNNRVLRDEEHVYFEIENIDEIYYEGYVYNCEVEEDHTYVVEGVVVHNCFVLPLEDDMGKIPGGIFQTLRDAALIQQTGGGNGFSFSRLRPKNAVVFSSMGRATGPVGFLRVYDRAFGEIAQGGTRRGANMAVLRVDHPDIEEFITCKTDENAITNFNISVGITDAFMRAVENDEEWELRFPDVLHPAYRNFRGTLEDAERAGIPIRVYKRVRARDLFRKIATQAHHNGEPGVLFLDTANRSNPVPHLYTLEATNPCVTGDTLVATPQGWRYAAEIRVGDEICTVLGTGRVERIEVYEQRPVYRVFLSDGGVIKVTAAHQFHVRDSRTKFYEPRRVDQLKPGDWVRVFPARMPNNPVPDKPPHLSDREFGFLIGVLVGDGCYTERALFPNVVRVSTHADEEEWNAVVQEAFQKLGATHFATYVNSGSHSMMMDPKPGPVIADWVRTLLLPPARSPEKRLPLAYINSNREFLEGLLDGLFSTDGSVDLSSNHPLLRFHTSSEELARQVRLILLMFGIHARIHRTVRKRHALNGREIRHDRPKYEVVISGASLGRFIEQIRLSHPEKRRRLEEAALRCNFTGGNWAAQVVKIEFAGYETVYDLYEPRSDTWITEGYVSRGCGEQWLGPYENCCLGSVNLARHVKYVNGKAEVDWEKLRETVEWATRFLDNVVQVNQYVPAVPQLKEAAFKTRRIGLGFMGLADLMYHLRIRYGSEEGQEFAAQIAEFIRYHAMRTSIELARERGPFPAIRGSIYDPEDLKWEPPKPLKPYTRDWGRPPLDWNAIVEGIRRHGIRNAAQTTVAPTGTLSTVAGCEGYGCEPVFALAYIRYVHEAEGRLELRYVSPLFMRALKEAGLDEETRARIIEEVLRKGTCQHIQELPDWIRHTFVVAQDLTPEEHVWMQASIQAFIDNSISKCVTGDTMVLTAQGLLPIAEISPMRLPDQFEPLDLDVVTPYGIKRAAAFYYGGRREIRRIHLAYGYQIAGTPNHRVHVLGPDGRVCFRRLDELQPGDLVVLYVGQQQFGPAGQPLPPYSGAYRTRSKPVRWPERMSPDLAYVLGWITSEGSITANGVTIAHHSRKLLEGLARLFEDLFGLKGHILKDKRREVYTLQVNSRALRHWLLNDLGMKAGARNKIIPLCVLKGSREEIKAFLKGLLQDAFMSQDGRMFGITLSSLTLIRQLQALFLNLGVLSRLHRSGPHAWGLTVSGKALERLAEFLEFEEPWKAQRLSRRHEGRRHRLFNYSELMPSTLTTALRAMQESSSRSLRSLYPEDGIAYQRARVALLKGHRLDRETAQAIYTHFHDVAHPYARAFFEEDREDRFFVEVERVESDFAEVFDLYVPDSHTFIANGLCNHNTINFPATATVEDVERAYMMAWKLGCKGLTVYVAGSRQKEVLETLETKAKKEQKEAAMVPAQPTLPQPVGPTVRPRPQKLAGVTYRIATPVGTAFITLNENGEGQPFEVFLNVGKAGSDIAAVAEAIGRLISLLLRLPSPVPPAERLRQVVDQLQGIGGGRALGFGPERVRSLPDGIARVLAEYLAERGLELPAAPAPAVQPALPLSEPHPGQEEPRAMGPVGDICPQCGEATLLEQEGCRTCYNCGYSEC